MAVYTVVALAQEWAVRLGLVNAADVRLHTGLNLCAAVLFYAAIRSGFNRRFSSDPSLTVAQSLWGMLSISAADAMVGPLRGALLPLMTLIMLFGMFSLRPRQARWVAAVGFTGLAMATLWRSVGPNPSAAPEVEAMHFALAAAVMGATALLAIRLGRLRARLSAQKAELADALEINRQLATRDMLTGLLNRRALVELLAQEQPRQRRAGGAMALALLDIDFFKRVNDTHGHQAGDAVLRRFADLAGSALRAGDALARWGGEEFLLLMPGTPPDAAMRAVARLRDTIAAGDFGAIAPGLTVSFSAGVVVCAGTEALDHAIERADRALYQAKHAGRDCAMCA